MLEVLAVIVAVNVLMTLSLWQVAARKPAKLKKKFIHSLLRSKPLVPKHQPAKAIGEGWQSHVMDNDRQFFHDFDDFADVINWWLAEDPSGSPWRLQELPDTELKLGPWYEPAFGRRYAIFYNQVNLGTLEVYALTDYCKDAPTVSSELEMELVRLLPFNAIRAFLTGIALHVACNDQLGKDYSQSCSAIDQALLAAVWQAQRISPYDLDPDYGELELQLTGSAVWYFERREALRNERSMATVGQTKS